MDDKLKTKPLVGIIMGSTSDWETMSHASQMLEELGVPHECEVVSAHRTPQKLCQYAESAEERKLRVIIAGAGGAAHLPGMTASMTHLPVLGVPVQSKALNGMDSLLSIVQMPAGIPVTTLAKATGEETLGLEESTIDAMQAGKIHMIINTPLGVGSREDGAKIRRLATRMEIPLITTMSDGVLMASIPVVSVSPQSISTKS